MKLAGQLRPIVAVLTVLAASVCVARAEEANDYPTAARAGGSRGEVFLKIFFLPLWEKMARSAG